MTKIIASYFSLKNLAFFLTISFFYASPPLIYGQTQVAKLLASNGKAEDFFGLSVSINGDCAIVGAPYHSENADWDGAAYIYKFDGNNWIEDKILTASDGYSYNNFGYSVSIYGDIAVVGSIGYSSFKGAVYVYKLIDTNWVEQQILMASDAFKGDNFGHSVDIDGDAILVGASGKGISKGGAYVFRYDGNKWVEEEPLSATDGIAWSYFGSSVAISNNIPFVGAFGDYYNGENSGSAYIFQKDGSAWIRVAKLFPKDGRTFDKFAASVDISGNVAIAGTRNNGYNDLGAGSAFVYRKNGNAWEMEQRLMASDGEDDDHFGNVAIDGNTIIVGANNEDENGLNAGAAYVFMWDGFEWVEEYKLIANDGFAEDWFGSTVSVSGNYAIIGAPQDNDNGSSAGSVYIFELKENKSKYKTIIREDFEGLIFPPNGWSIKKSNQTSSWEKLNIKDTLNFSNIMGASKYSAICPWSKDDQDEWLISPPFTLGSGKSYLKFYAGYGSKDLGNYFLRLFITTDNGQNWNAIWSAEKTGLTWRWKQVIIDLSPLANLQNLKLGWEYSGKDGDLAGIDGVIIKAEEGSTGINENEILPITYSLSQNYPNPFNPTTKIKYSIPNTRSSLLGGVRGGLITMNVYDVLGREVTTLVNETKQPGEYEVEFNASNLPSGVYFYQIKAGEFIETKKMILLK